MLEKGLYHILHPNMRSWVTLNLWKSCGKIKELTEGFELLQFKNVSAEEVLTSWEYGSLIAPNKVSCKSLIIEKLLHDLKQGYYSKVELFVEEVFEASDNGQNMHHTLFGLFVKIALSSQTRLLWFIGLPMECFMNGSELSENCVVRIQILQAIARKCYEWLVEKKLIHSSISWPTSEVRINIAIVGEPHSGISSLFYRLMHNSFPAAHLQLTMTTDFFSFYAEPLFGSLRIKVFVWDASSLLQQTISKRADGFIVLYDASNIGSTRRVKSIVSNCISNEEKFAKPMVVFGNKVDSVLFDPVEDTIHGYFSSLIGSALTGQNTNEIMSRIVYETALVKYQRSSLSMQSSTSPTTTMASYSCTSKSKGLNWIGNSSIFSWYRLLLPL